MSPLHVLLVMVPVVIWAFGFPVVKFGIDQMPPVFMMALRFMLMWPVVLFVPVPRGQLRAIAATSVTLGTLHFAFMFTGVGMLDAATAAILAQAQVPISAILAAILLRDRPGWRRIAGTAVAFAGLVVTVGRPGSLGQLDGVACVLIAALLFAVGSVQMKRLQGLQPLQMWGWMSLFSVPQLLIISALVEDGQMQALAQTDWRGWAAVVYMAVAVTLIAHGAWFWLLQRHPISLLNPFMLLTVPLGLLAAALLRGERIDPQMILGATLTVAGIAVILIRRPGTVRTPPA